MGAWETDPFGNDTACDWQYELEETDDLSSIESTLETIQAVGSEYLDASDAEEAIAAADAIARLKGNFYVKNSYTNLSMPGLSSILSNRLRVWWILRSQCWIAF